MEEFSLCGIAGRFPESANVEEFWNNLLAGKDLVTEDERRWKPGILTERVLKRSETPFTIL